MNLILLFTLRLFSYCMCQAGEPLEEPVYILNVDSPIYVCPDDESQAFVDTSDIEVHRHNESTAYMAGVFKMLKTLDRQTVIEMLVEKETSGRHDLVTSIEICDFCDELEDPESIYADSLKYFGFPETCPIVSREINSQSTYNVDNFVVDTSNLPINSANVGRYQATINIYDNPSGSCKNDKTFVACLKMDLVIEPV